jgi:uncharacterized Tic20 family protein
MAKLTLYTDELDRPLPQVCMRCGAPATLVKEKRFSWGPPWASAIMLAGFLILGLVFVLALFILIPLLMWRRTVPVPLCEQHKNHWLPYQITMYSGLIVLGGLITAIVYLVATAKAAWDPKVNTAYMLGFGGIVFLVLLIVVGSVLLRQTIRPEEITEDKITLVRVHEDFIAALEAQDAPRKKGKPVPPPQAMLVEEDDEDRGQRRKPR